MAFRPRLATGLAFSVDEVRVLRASSPLLVKTSTEMAAAGGGGEEKFFGFEGGR